MKAARDPGYIAPQGVTVGSISGQPPPSRPILAGALSPSLERLERAAPARRRRAFRSSFDKFHPPINQSH